MKSTTIVFISIHCQIADAKIAITYRKMEKLTPVQSEKKTAGYMLMPKFGRKIAEKIYSKEINWCSLSKSEIFDFSPDIFVSLTLEALMEIQFY